MTSTPIFSVVIPCYNRSSSILPTLRSVKSQSYSNFECIIVDDGSKDSQQLEAVVRELDDARFRYVHRANGGGGAARNTGVDAAVGSYIAFLDSDDLFAPNKLERMLATINDDLRICWYSQVIVDRGVERRWIKPTRAIGENEDVGEYMFADNHVIQTSSIVIRTETARVVRFDPNLRKGQDLDFCVRLQAHGVRFVMAPEALSIWHDVTEVNRTSRVSGHEQPLAWLNAHRALLTSKAIAGYRANVLAYHTAQKHPLIALRYLAEGLAAGVNSAIIARQLLRCFLPRNVYRKGVNAFVGIFGKKTVG